MTDTAIRLIVPASRQQDEYGVWRTTAEKSREIPAMWDSVSRSEFSAAGQDGPRPELRFTIFAAEYQGESICEYNGKRYAIYRDYYVPGTDYLELYVQREVGVHGAQNGT